MPGELADVLSDGIKKLLLARLTLARAGYLDELGPTNIPADVDTLLARLTSTRAGYLDELGPTNIPADVDTLLARLTSTRAGYLDNLQYYTQTKANYIDTSVSSRLGTLQCQVFTSSGTWTKPSNVSWVYVLLVGGGGGGGRSSSSYGGGGGGGQVVTRFVRVTGDVSVTIGAGGAGATDKVGGNGGSSSFGTLLTALGGGGGDGVIGGRGGGKVRKVQNPDLTMGFGSSGGSFGGDGGDSRDSDGRLSGDCAGYGSGGYSSGSACNCAGGGSFGKGADWGYDVGATDYGAGGSGNWYYDHPGYDGAPGYCEVYWIQ